MKRANRTVGNPEKILHGICFKKSDFTFLGNFVGHIAQTSSYACRRAPTRGVEIVEVEYVIRILDFDTILFFDTDLPMFALILEIILSNQTARNLISNRINKILGYLVSVVPFHSFRMSSSKNSTLRMFHSPSVCLQDLKFSNCR